MVKYHFVVSRTCMTRVSRCPHSSKSRGLKSGELGGHAVGPVTDSDRVTELLLNVAENTLYGMAKMRLNIIMHIKILSCDCQSYNIQ
jgi:hypothetical protein